ncbi:MAG: response regulator [Flavobacteriales bacterium]|nr:response regulator [Flavobacteriales bacterium]
MKRILIIDDELDIGTLMSWILRERGYKVDYASTSPDASAFLKLHRYEAVFLDINLGVSDGLDLMPEIKENQNGVRVVVVSAYGDKSVRDSARKAGASQFILKPFSKNQILRSLEK